jgi:hypothetical protein
MTKEQIAVLFERAATWPEAAKREFVRVAAEIEAKFGGVYQLTEEEDADIRAALEEADRGDFATDADVHTVFDRLRHA